jgi:hypothetical protein
MNNTRTLAVVAVLMAAILVVGTGTLGITTTSSIAFAYNMKKPVQDTNNNKEGGSSTTTTCIDDKPCVTKNCKINEPCNNTITLDSTNTDDN